MKNVYLLFSVVVLFAVSSTLYGQSEGDVSKKKSDVEISKNLQKGTQQIALQGLSFGWGYGRIIGSVGFRYGYFIADKNLLFIDANFASYGYGSSYFSSKVGLNYRMYFTNHKVKPFAQIGVHYGWGNDSYAGKSTFWELSTAGGAAVQVGKFGFELGLQLHIRDKVSIFPLVGVSFRF